MPIDLTELELFLRDVLDCKCPDEVLQQIEVDACPAAFGEMPDSHLIRFGGRLLVLVVANDDWEAMIMELPRLFDRGRRLRDTAGYNRFRLVIATSAAGTARQHLEERFHGLRDRDEHLHLHVITPEQLPLSRNHRRPNRQGRA